MTLQLECQHQFDPFQQTARIAFISHIERNTAYNANQQPFEWQFSRGGSHINCFFGQVYKEKGETDAYQLQYKVKKQSAAIALADRPCPACMLFQAVIVHLDRSMERLFFQ